MRKRNYQESPDIAAMTLLAQQTDAAPQKKTLAAQFSLPSNLYHSIFPEPKALITRTSATRSSTTNEKTHPSSTNRIITLRDQRLIILIKTRHVLKSSTLLINIRRPRITTSTKIKLLVSVEVAAERVRINLRMVVDAVEYSRRDAVGGVLAVFGGEGFDGEAGVCEWGGVAG